MNLTTKKWQPSASIDNLRQRSIFISKIRRFFLDRGILEVDTPTITRSAATDIYLSSFKTKFFDSHSNEKGIDLYLITSPECHMKRLLAAGSGSIYQISRCFRNEENGRYHNPEFSMLEWYRPYYNMDCLMHEVNELIQQILECESAEWLSYQEAFIKYLNIDPFLDENIEQLYEISEELGNINLRKSKNDKDTLLTLSFILGIEPKIGQHKPCFIYDFPSTQAAMAEISKSDKRIAKRFEVYYKNIELANGFQELIDSNEQHQRFKNNNRRRLENGLPSFPIDTNLLDALADDGMPSCSGVALGVDRLIMLALKVEYLSEVIAFPVDRC